jgi:general secretion pathway protein I
MRRQNKAFTLIEILVALVILAIALLAGVKVIGDGARAQMAVQRHSTAMWVADQLISEIQLNLLNVSDNVSQQGQIQMLNQSWPWQINVVQSNVAGKRINVRVFASDNRQVLASASTFIARSANE